MKHAVLPPGLIVSVDYPSITGGDITTDFTRITARAAGMAGELELLAHGLATRVRGWFGEKDL